MGRDSEVTKVDPYRGLSEFSFLVQIPRYKPAQAAVPLTSD
jgi:hypothetical protein